MKKVLILSNGEGRGHLTQVLSFKSILQDSEYEIVGCILGSTEGKKIPAYFKNNIEVPVWEIETPQFIKNGNKSLSISKTILHNIFKIGKFNKSLNQIQHIVESVKPDIIINFYEVLTGLWCLKYKNDIPVISIAHQYLLNHSSFKFPDNIFFNILSLKFMNKLTSYGSKEKWCLSFYDTNNENNLKIMPPLLRSEIFDKEVSKEDFILVYLCNEGYLSDIKNIAKCSNENFKVFINVDKQYSLLPNLTVYPLSDKDFLEEMSKCKAIMMTSGFESVCEARYLNKPCLLVPIENHYEQKCNAFDAQISDIGEFSESFDVIKLLWFIERYKSDNSKFIEWVKSSKVKILSNLNI